MDLLAITTPAIGVVNPRVPMSLEVSTGNSISSDGTQVPTYADAVTVMAEIQPLTSNDLRQLDALNIQGSFQAIYIEGQTSGIVRAENKGGDLITDQSGKVWLVTMVLESWPDWCKVAVTLQLTPEE